MIAIGVGCRRGCPAEDIVGLIEATLLESPRRAPVLGLFSVEEKRDEAGLIAAARRMDLPLTFFDRATLDRASEFARTRSARVAAQFGVPSVAETAALAGAGVGAVLLVTRRASRTSTCAIAGSRA